MTTWLPGIKVIDHGFGGSRAGNAIKGIIVHARYTPTV